MIKPSERADKILHLPMTHSPNKFGQTEELLRWYCQNARKLAWRITPQQYAAGLRANPYHVWLSETMLQQTTVKTVAAYFADFVARWPDLPNLARAGENEILSRWAGLGYYSRARNLFKCAQIIQETYGGEFPREESELIKLPGIGAYTAAAIAAIAFDRRAGVVDGNIARILGRYFAFSRPANKIMPELRQTMWEIMPEQRCGDFVQALMDLSASLCRPNRPSCDHCPLRGGCTAFATGRQNELPVREKKKPMRRLYTTAFALIDHQRSLLLHRRPDSGLLAAMSGIPLSPFLPEEELIAPTKRGAARHDVGKSNIENITANLPLPSALAELRLDWLELPGRVVHKFTHIDLSVRIVRAYAPQGMAPPEGYWWSHPDRAREALPKLMQKIIDHATGRDC